MSVLDDLKLLMGDPLASIFTEAEYNQFLTLQSNDVYMAAHDAHMSLAAAASRKAYMTRTGTKMTDFRGIAKALREMASDFKAKSEGVAAYGGVAEIAWTPEAEALLLINKTLRTGGA